MGDRQTSHLGLCTLHPSVHTVPASILDAKISEFGGDPLDVANPGFRVLGST